MLARMSQALARIVSILGHPLLILPAAVLSSIAMREPDPAQVWAYAAGFAVIGLGVMAWSWRQVRRRRWTHIDASRPDERRSLNRFLLIVLGCAVLLAWWRGAPALALGLGLSAGLIVAALALAPWCKLSLHVAFAVFAAGLLWALSPLALGAGALFASAVAWSRWRLARHTPRDLLAGAVVGALAARLYWHSMAVIDARAAL